MLKNIRSATTTVNRLIIVLVRGMLSLLQILPAAIARINVSATQQLLHCFAVRVQPLALPHLCIPRNSEPAKVLSDRLGELRARPLSIKILKAEPEPSLRCPRTLRRHVKGPRMPQVQ
jgi:hypothetical protein